jgi:hypothetical protein
MHSQSASHKIPVLYVTVYLENVSVHFRHNGRKQYHTIH